MPGYSACLSEPVSRRPTVSTKSHTGLRFRKDDVDLVPHEDDIAYASHIDETLRLSGILHGMPGRIGSLLGNPKPLA